MKKIKINSILFKYLIFTFIYLKLLLYPLNNFINIITVLGTNLYLDRLYERFYFGLESVCLAFFLVAMILIYIITFCFTNFYRYIKLFIEIFLNEDLWIISIADEKSTQTDTEIMEESFKKTDEHNKFIRCCKANFYSLILLYIALIMINFSLVCINSIIG